MRIKDDDGYILIAAIGAILLVTVIAMGSYAVAQRSLNDARITTSINQAYQIASSAAEYEVARFESGANITSATNKQLPNGGSYDVVVTLSADRTKLGMECVGRADGRTERVQVGYSSFDPSESIYTGSGNIFSGAAFNSKDSMIIGPMYMTLAKDEKIDSNPSFVDGPLWVANGQLTVKQGTFKTTTAEPYQLYLDKRITPEPNNTQTTLPAPKMVPPLISAEMTAKFKAKAVSQSQYYTSNTNIGGSSGPYRFQVGSNGVLTANGTIFVEGVATIDSAVKSYTGNFTIYATKGIVSQGRLVPTDYAANPTSTTAAYVDTKYASTITTLGKAEQLPQARAGYCASLVSPGPINLAWSSGNNATSVFSFCGALFSSGVITFQESLRGSIIGRDALDPNKKTILATQQELRNVLPEEMKELLARVLIRGYWVRK